MSKIGEAVPWGFTEFCDDLRHEIDGKRTFVGTYPGSMNIHGNFPTLLPKFAMALAFYEPHPYVLMRDFEIPVSIILPGETFETASFKANIPVPPAEMLENIRNLPSPQDEDEIRFTRLDVNFVAAPLIIKEAGAIKVRARYGDQLIRMCSLTISLVSAPSS